MRAQAGLIPDRETRQKVLEVIYFLNQARNQSVEENWPGVPDRDLYRPVEALAGEGTEIVEAYLRRDSFETRRAGFIDRLAKTDAEYDAWQREQWQRHDERTEDIARRESNE